jgi:hypothetical protein
VITEPLLNRGSLQLVGSAKDTEQYEQVACGENRASLDRLGKLALFCDETPLVHPKDQDQALNNL